MMANYGVFDSETCNTPTINNKLVSDDGQVYDCCLRIINDEGETKAVLPMINSDVFFGMPDAMKEAYYADKIPQYMKDIWDKKYNVLNTYEMRKRFHELCKEWDVQALIAHNACFDIRVLNSTMRYQTKSKMRYFLPYGIPLIDSMIYFRQTIGKTEKYVNWCKEHGFMTRHTKPRPRVSAEVIWKFLTENTEYTEKHTGVDDTEIEAQIFLACRAYEMGI